MTLNYSNSHSSLSGRWICLWGQRITRTQGTRFKPQIPIWFRAAVLLPQHSAGVWAVATETDFSCNLMVLWVSCTDIQLQIQSSPEVAPKYSSAAMEDKSVQRVSEDSLAAALPAARAGHSLQSSPRVKWVPNALPLLSARGRWKASKWTSFVIHCWIIRPTSNEITFEKNPTETENSKKNHLSSSLYRENESFYTSSPDQQWSDTFVF